MRIKYLTLLFPALCLFGCDGLFDNIYDKVPEIDVTQPGFHRSPGSNILTLRLDARNYDSWHFISLKNLTVEEHPIPQALDGEWDGRSALTYHEVHGDRYEFLSSTPIAEQTEPAEWDLAIHHFDVRTNLGAAVQTAFTSLDELSASQHSVADEEFTADEWSDRQVIVDLRDMMAFRIGYQNSLVNSVLSSWVKMDISSPPPTFSASGRVYILRMKDGTHTALRLRNYMNENGQKGILTIDFLYPY